MDRDAAAGRGAGARGWGTVLTINLPIRWRDPNPPGRVEGFTFYASSPGTLNLTMGDLGMPTPDEEGVYHATIQVADSPAYVGLTAYTGNARSFMSNVKLKFAPEAGSTLMLLAGVVMLAVLWRYSSVRTAQSFIFKKD